MTSGQPRACLEAGATRGCVPRCLQGISPNLRNLPLEGERDPKTTYSKWHLEVERQEREAAGPTHPVRPRLPKSCFCPVNGLRWQVIRAGAMLARTLCPAFPSMAS